MAGGSRPGQAMWLEMGPIPAMNVESFHKFPFIKRIEGNRIHCSFFMRPYIVICYIYHFPCRRHINFGNDVSPPPPTPNILGYFETWENEKILLVMEKSCYIKKLKIFTEETYISEKSQCTILSFDIPDVST